MREVVSNRRGQEIGPQEYYNRKEKLVLSQLGYTRKEVIDLLDDGNHEYTGEQLLIACIEPSMWSNGIVDNSVVAINNIIDMALQGESIGDTDIVFSQTLNRSVNQSKTSIKKFAQWLELPWRNR